MVLTRAYHTIEQAVHSKESKTLCQSTSWSSTTIVSFATLFCELLNACYDHLQIIPAGDGSAALSLTRQISFDLIILDYELTTFSGGDVVRRLRARGTALPPIILISAHPDLPVIARLHMVNGYLQKRITLIQFLTMGAPFL